MLLLFFFTSQARQDRAEKERQHERYKKRMKELKLAKQQGLLVRVALGWTLRGGHLGRHLGVFIVGKGEVYSALQGVAQKPVSNKVFVADDKKTKGASGLYFMLYSTGFSKHEKQ